MHNILVNIKSIVVSPVVLILYLLITQNRRNIIKEDLKIWAIWKKRSCNIHGLVNLFCEYPEFRNLFYFRVGYISYLFSWLIKGETSLFFRTKHIAPGLLIQHGFSTIIDADSIGTNCKIFQQVTIGYKGDARPTIGKNVVISAGAKVLGGVSVGDNVIIGANAVVVKDVPNNCIVGGVPAKVIKELINHVDIFN